MDYFPIAKEMSLTPMHNIATDWKWDENLLDQPGAMFPSLEPMNKDGFKLFWWLIIRDGHVIGNILWQCTSKSQGTQDC